MAYDDYDVSAYAYAGAMQNVMADQNQPTALDHQGAARALPSPTGTALTIADS